MGTLRLQEKSAAGKNKRSYHFQGCSFWLVVESGFCCPIVFGFVFVLNKSITTNKTLQMVGTSRGKFNVWFWSAFRKQQGNMRVSDDDEAAFSSPLVTKADVKQHLQEINIWNQEAWITLHLRALTIAGWEGLFEYRQMQKLHSRKNRFSTDLQYGIWNSGKEIMWWRIWGLKEVNNLAWTPSTCCWEKANTAVCCMNWTAQQNKIILLFYTVLGRPVLWH